MKVYAVIVLDHLRDRAIFRVDSIWSSEEKADEHSKQTPGAHSFVESFEVDDTQNHGIKRAVVLLKY